MAGQPPPAEQHLKDEHGDTSQKAERISEMRGQIKPEREINQRAND